jgi:hypothetical protein
MLLVFRSGLVKPKQLESRTWSNIVSDINNLTPFACLTDTHVDAHGRLGRLVVVKGIWHLNTNRLADQPGALVIRKDVLTMRIDELGLDTLQQQVMKDHLDENIDWLPTDLSPPKPKFDLLLSGHAYTEDGKTQRQFIAGVVHPKHKVTLVLHAPRLWEKTLLQGGGGIPGDHLGSITRVPVHPRFSFGGEGSGAQNLYNPQGMGSPAAALATSSKSKSLNEIALPWIEHPEHPVVNVTRSPLPASFGLWGENTGSRSPHYGTRDQAWQQERAPRPPLDFNPLYYNQAEPRLQWNQPPQPGEPIEFHHLTRDGFSRLVWPAVRPQVFVGHQAGPTMVADTCLVAPDAGLYAIVWRCIVPPAGLITLQTIHA